MANSKVKTATYFRAGWVPVVLMVLTHDKSAGTIDLADRDGNPVVTGCPLVDDAAAAQTESAAAVLGGHLPPSDAEMKAAAEKQAAADRKKQAEAKAKVEEEASQGEAAKAAQQNADPVQPGEPPAASPANAPAETTDPVAEAAKKAKAAAEAKKADAKN